MKVIHTLLQCIYLYTYYHEHQVQVQSLAEHPEIVDQHQVMQQDVKRNTPTLKMGGEEISLNVGGYFVLFSLTVH